MPSLDLIHRRTTCRSIAARLAGFDELDPATQAHVETCLRCQAELVGYRKLVRALASLRSEAMFIPAGLVEDIIAFVHDTAESADTKRTRVRRALATGGVIVLAGGAIAGAVVAVVFHRNGPGGTSGALAASSSVLSHLRPAS
jgi:hypothetical protein